MNMHHEWVQRYNAITISIATSIKSLNKQKWKAFIDSIPARFVLWLHSDSGPKGRTGLE